MSRLKLFSVLGSAVLGLTMSGCTTTQAGSGVKVGGPDVRRPAGDAVQGEVTPQISSKAKLLFDDAVKAYDNQRKARVMDYPSLEKKFQAAADADSNLAEADFNLGVLAERQGKLKEAVSHYKEALSKKPTLRQAAENLAVIAQNQGDEQGAVGIYQDILANYPDDASSRARLAEIYRRRGDNDKAMELAREALFRDPKTLQAYKTMMNVSLDQKQYAMTRLIALRASRIDENDPEIAYTVGLINLAEKDPVKARVQFKRAVEARADYLPAHYQLAKLALDQEDYSGAEEHLRRILQANANNAEALVDLGVAYKGMGQYDKALAAYDAAQKVKSDLPALVLNRGIIIGLKGDPEKAITYFKQYIVMSGGEAQVSAGHPVFGLIKDQENAIARKEEEKKALEEARKMEEEQKKADAAAAEEDRKKKDEAFKKQQADAKGNASKEALKEEAPKPAPESAPKAKTPAPAPAPAPPPPAAKKPSADEPTDGL
jgi:tetratricopeptide (TPR) repeat protein